MIMANLVDELFFYADQLKRAVIDAAKRQGMEKISLEFINTIAENDEDIKHHSLRSMITMHVYYDV